MDKDSIPSLKELVGKKISVSLHRLGSDVHIEAMLVGVETSGLWLSGELVSSTIFSEDDLPERTSDPVVFFPFGAIHYLLNASPEEYL